ncbi:hypothetical protein ACHAPT_008365 [Fusarium lateritium]
MEAVGATANVIAIATLAWQSSKAACDLIDGLVEAPRVIADTRRRLLDTQSTLGLLQTQLITHKEPPQILDSLLEQIRLSHSIELTRHLCDEFQDKLREYTQHSTPSNFSTRDKFVVNFHESTIRKINTELSNSHLGMTTVLASINLILSSHIANDINGLADSLAAQERALTVTSEQLMESQRVIEVQSTGEGGDEDPGTITTTGVSPLIAELDATCKRTRDAVKSTRTGQQFGNMELNNKSRGMQGIVGTAQQGVDQKFGNFKALNESKGFQGQIDSDSFAKMLQ